MWGVMVNILTTHILPLSHSNPNLFSPSPPPRPPPPSLPSISDRAPSGDGQFASGMHRSTVAVNAKKSPEATYQRSDRNLLERERERARERRAERVRRRKQRRAANPRYLSQSEYEHAAAQDDPLPVTSYCVCQSIDLEHLEKALRQTKQFHARQYAGALHLRWRDQQGLASNSLMMTPPNCQSMSPHEDLLTGAPALTLSPPMMGNNAVPSTVTATAAVNGGGGGGNALSPPAPTKEDVGIDSRHMQSYANGSRTEQLATAETPSNNTGTFRSTAVLANATDDERDPHRRAASLLLRREDRKSEREVHDIFVVSYGCIVFWNVDEELHDTFLELIRPIMQEPDPDFEVDQLDYYFGRENRVNNDQLVLSGTSSSLKLSLSFALCQSVKLSTMEERIEAQIELNKDLPQEMARTGVIQLSAKEVAKRIGRLFIERSNVNLHTDVLDTPGYFWEHDKHLSFFKATATYLEVSKRASVLNARLDVLQELYSIIRESQNERHATRLEMIIIWLIVAEVLLQLLGIAIEYFQLSY
jgi:uncharacterized Rmd1/YagE family protein